MINEILAFFNQRSIPFCPEQINHILLYPTFRCNYSCSYCHINKLACTGLFPRETERSFQEWEEALEIFSSAEISISGGEPFLFDEIVPLINNLPQKHKLINLTTNLSLPFDKFKDIDKKDFNISVSFHTEMTTKETLKDNILKLKSYGFNVNVNFVAHPNLLNLIPILKSFFEKELGVLFWVDPYLDPTYKYSKEEIRIVKKYVRGNRKLGFDVNDKDVKYCLAGSKYFFILPNGDVYTCHAGFYYIHHPLYKRFYSDRKDKFYLGNLFNNTFTTPLVEKKICSLPCCEGCDLDYASITRKNAYLFRF